MSAIAAQAEATACFARRVHSIAAATREIIDNAPEGALSDELRQILSIIAASLVDADEGRCPRMFATDFYRFYYPRWIERESPGEDSIAADERRAGA